MFQEGFRTAHISTGVMSLKKREFRNLRQGNHTVAGYIEDFNNLARYAPDDVDTDAKMKEKFLDGLNDELAIQLSVVYTPNYQSLLDKATILGNKMTQAENRKRKHSSSKYHSETSHKRHNHYEGSSGNKFHNHGNNHIGGNGHNHHGHNHNEDQKGSNGDNKDGNHNGNGNGNGQHSHQGKKDLSHIKCYKCKNMGHYSSGCPEKKDIEAAKPNPFQK